MRPLYHWERDGAGACGAKSDGLHLVDRAARATCTRCLRLANLEPLRIAVAERPARDVLLGDLIELLCDAEPAERRALCDEALSRIGGTK